MPATKPESAVRGLARLARAGAAPMSREQHLAGRERLIAAVDALAPRPRIGRWLALAAAAAAALALLAVIALRRPEARLAFTVDGASPGEGYLQAGPAGAAIHFSEGTVIALAPGARGRVATVGAAGARVSLEDGGARFDVVHRPGAAWIAEAGPFTIAVTGTSFDLRWSGARMEIVMRAGSVLVKGPPAPDGIVLRAGQRLVADARRAEVSPAADTTTPTSSASLPAPPVPEAPTASAAPPHPREPAPTWRARVAAGDFAGVIAEAEARGLDAAVASSALPDLAALADAARYAGRGDLARRALLAERERFPGSAEARSAAFLLGRMAEAGDPAAAVGFYDRYLAESPGGSLAAEALGRRMLALRASAGRDAARPAAEEYHRRYPDGPYAAAAAEILGEP